MARPTDTELRTATIAERAAAKINLTLRVARRRPDGYHEIDSLVAFAQATGDDILLEPDGEPEVTVRGAFAGAIVGPNLLIATLSLLHREHPALRIGRVLLTKRLPVAAGLGGGSADAAALLRAVRRLNPDIADSVDWMGLAARLGADVPVCLAGEPARMRGIGERLSPVRALPLLPLVLANSLAAVPADKTARVFRALAAPTAPDPSCSSEDEPLTFPNRDRLLDYMAMQGNGLVTAACFVMPEITVVRTALAGAPGCLLAALTGAGPTCFGVFGSKAEADAVAASLSAHHPRWWIRAAEIGG